MSTSSQQTRRPRVIFEENSGLASVFPIDYVEEVIQKALAEIGESAEPELSDPVNPDQAKPTNDGDNSKA